MKGYKFCLWKAYFDTGLGLTSYVKWLIAFFGITSRSMGYTFLLAFLYPVFCFFLGWYWIRFGYLDAQNEVGNQFNPFVKEMRQTYKKRNI